MAFDVNEFSLSTPDCSNLPPEPGAIAIMNKVRRKIFVTPAYAGACGVPKFVMVVSIMPFR